MPRGRGRQRSRLPDPMPPPEQLITEVRDLVILALEVTRKYRSIYDGLGYKAGGEISIRSGGDSSPTEGAWATQEELRADCRRAVKKMRSAYKTVQVADFALGGPAAAQPAQLDHRAVVTREEFDQALHRKRERELQE